MSIVSKQAESDIILRPGQPAPFNKDAALVSSLRSLLADTITFSLRLQGAHWNVTGSDFPQLHALFSMIYEDVDGSIDPLAENIRKMGGQTPYRMVELSSIRSLSDGPEVGGDDRALMQALMSANDDMIAAVLRSFAVANAANEQGIANFLAERDDAHKKWAWQLKSTLAG